MTIDIGLIGAGGIGTRHGNILHSLDGVNVPAVCDINEERAVELARDLSARSYDRPHELYAAEVLDAVYVTTPPVGRLEVIRGAIENDLAVFCEKPLAADVTQGRAIAGLVSASDLPFMMGFCSRFCEPCRRLKARLDDGDIGTPVTFVSQRAGWGVPSGDNWRIDPKQSCGITIESASHNVDLLRWLGGEVQAAAGTVTNVTHPELPGFDDNLVGILSFEDGAIASVYNSWTSRLAFLRHGVIGTEGAVFVEGDDWWRLDRLRYAHEDASHVQTTEFSSDEATAMGYRRESEVFVDCLRTNSTPPAAVDDGLRALEICTELRECSGVSSSP